MCQHVFVSKDFDACGCMHEVCSECGVIHKVSVCDFHKPFVCDYNSKDYFVRDEMSNFVDGVVPNNKSFIDEHLVAFDLVGLDLSKLRGSRVLEVGGGLGRLVPFFLKNGCDYSMVEVSSFACDFVSNCFDVSVFNSDFMSWKNNGNKFDFVFCCHTLEHVDDAWSFFYKLFKLVKKGGFLFVEVPLGSDDFFNPDHWWFFDSSVLDFWGKLVGLNLKGFSQLRVSGCKEDYLYFLWRK